MKITHLIGLTLLTLSAAATVHAEEKRYISDELSTWVRSGPGNDYRLIGTLNAGEEVALLQSNDSSKYGQIRDSQGRTTWIPLAQLSQQPSLRTRVPQLEEQVKELTAKLANIDGSWNNRTAEMQKKVAGSDDAINSLKEENQQLKNQLVVAKKKSMRPMCNWMTSSAPSLCSGLCMVAVSRALAWYWACCFLI